MGVKSGLLVPIALEAFLRLVAYLRVVCSGSLGMQRVTAPVKLMQVCSPMLPLCYVVYVRQTHASMQCMSACLLICGVAGQVVVQLAVDKSRSVCLSVANGEVDVAIIGGHVPEDLKDVLQVMLHGFLFMLWLQHAQNVHCKPMFPWSTARKIGVVPEMTIKNDSSIQPF